MADALHGPAVDGYDTVSLLDPPVPFRYRAGDHFVHLWEKADNDQNVFSSRVEW